MATPLRSVRWQVLVAVAVLLAALPLSSIAVHARDQPTAPAVAPAAEPLASDYVQRVVDLTNEERAQAGLPALAIDASLNSSALAHSQDMASHSFFSHTGSNGSTVDQRIKAAGYSPLWAYGENIAAGQPSPEEVVDAWMNSEGHRANILSPHYTQIGVAYVNAAGTTYVHYWTQDFASHGQVQPPTAVPPTPVPPTPVPPTPVPPTPVPPTPVPPTPVPPTPVPPTPVPPTPVPPTPTPIPPTPVPTTSPVASTVICEQLRQMVLRVNQERAHAGLAALALDPGLLLAAQGHSIDMARNDLFSHTGSDGATLAQRATAMGCGSPSPLLEDIAGGQLSAGEAVSAWMNSPTLRANILNPNLDSIGVGYAYNGNSTYQHYWTLNLANHGGAPLALVSPVSLEGTGGTKLDWLSLLRPFSLCSVR